ncbi:MAG TPA: DUF2064 domain-containing protein [Actinocrinis sp.]|jgi:glycosyltransferase A (GT-A) superfamily protein (DUF2064 family)/SAM-dependent methyltransferase
MSTLIVLAKQPLPGRVKTRLCPPFTLEQAAALAEALLRDTFDAALACRADDRLLYLAGETGPWLPDGFDVLPQPGGGLDERIAAAFVAVAETARQLDPDDDDSDPGPALLIGMDTPQVTAGLLDRALTALRDGADAAFGPAEDGGFWALGFSGRWLRAKDALERMLLGVPMSRDDTGRIQLARLIEEGLDIEILPPLRDIDTAADARHVAGLVPAGALAARLAELEEAPDPDRCQAQIGVLLPAPRPQPEVEGPAADFGERDFGDWTGAVSSSYERALWGALTGAALPVLLQDEAGGVAFQLDVAKYHGAADTVDAALLSRCTGPTLDIGCGPGRLAAELAQRGIPALGVDVAPIAVLLARAAGATVLRRSVFERLPGEGRWPHALLIDGNIGIGGDPGALLRRIKDVLLPLGGELLVEVDAQEIDERLTLRVAGHGAPIAWARLGIAALQAAALPLGYRLAAHWIADGRHFAALAT